MSQPLHHKHRERMRERYLNGGFESFADYELLEMMLGPAIPRRNTNDIAHMLLERFGSLQRVLDASVDELAQVDGIGPIAAVAIKVNQEIARRYLQQSIPTEKFFTELSRVVYFLHPKFNKEHVYLLLFNNRMEMLDCSLVSVGSVNRSHIPISNMVQTAMNKKASIAIIAHNHPQGLPEASGDDKAISGMIEEAFSLVDVYLLEHLIFTDDAFHAILKNIRGDIPPTGKNRDVCSRIRNKFYDLEESEYSFSAFVDKAIDRSDSSPT